MNRQRRPAPAPSPAPTLAAPSRPKRSPLLLIVVALIVLAVAVLLILTRSEDPSAPLTPEAIAAEAARILADRQRIDREYFADEIAALRYETALTKLWDALLASDNQLLTLADAADFTTLTLAQPAETTQHDNAVTFTRYTRAETPSPDLTLTRDQFAARLRHFHADGYSLDMADFHHIFFDPRAAPPRSTVRINLYVRNPATHHRLAIRAEVAVAWSDRTDPAGRPIPGRLTVESVNVAQRTAPPLFADPLIIEPGPFWGLPSAKIGPLLVHDLNGDNLPEIILAASNLRYDNLGPRGFQAAQLLPRAGWSPLRDEALSAALIADLTGDGLPDIVTAEPVQGRGQIMLYVGNTRGRFESSPIPLTNSDSFQIRNPLVITAGDIDLDGDLDLFISQYRGSYIQGNMATPFWDADDGFPSYLLRNDGHSRFTDITELSGLFPDGKKRFRRAYSGSFVDLDGDLDLDLLTVNDYSGVDIFLNDGAGRFTDATASALPERHLFGMAHAFDDFNGDTLLDFYAIGMSSTSVERLLNMKLRRLDAPTPAEQMRELMGSGNRLYFGAGAGRFSVPPVSAAVAPAGWAWGTATLDFDNDGDRDIYVANGHISSPPHADNYDSLFWRHDLYTGNSEPSPAVSQVFAATSNAVNSRGQSWAGYEKNVLYTARDGSFADTAYLLGVGLDFDGRAAVAADIDLDGRVDLLTTAERGPGKGQALYLARNLNPDPRHWIGLHLRPGPTNTSPIGAVVRLETSRGTQSHWIVTGDSLSSQHPATAHFGLGDLDTVRSLTVTWPDGRKATLDSPAVDQYHVIVP